MSDAEHEYQVQINHSKDGLTNLPESIVIVPIANTPIFPGMIAPIILSEDRFTKELDKAIQASGHVGLNLVKPLEDEDFDDEEEGVIPRSVNKKGEHLGDEELSRLDERAQQKRKSQSLKSDQLEVSAKDIYRVGVFCKVVKKIQLPDGSVNLLVHGMKRYRASEIISERPLLRCKFELFNDILEADEELDAYTRSVINQVKKLSEINPYFNEEMKLAMLNSPSPGALADLVAFSLSLEIPEAQDFLETLVVKKRFGKLLVYLKREKDVADIQKKISDEVNDKVNKYQKEYFLREQLKVIRSELGMEEDEKSKDLKKMKEGLNPDDFPDYVLKALETEISRLELIPDSSPEYNVARTYINLLFELPWKKESKEEVDIIKATKILEKDHYGLEKAKKRILEFLAVRKLRPQYDGTILWGLYKI